MVPLINLLQVVSFVQTTEIHKILFKLASIKSEFYVNEDSNRNWIFNKVLIIQYITQLSSINSILSSNQIWKEQDFIMFNNTTKCFVSSKSKAI